MVNKSNYLYIYCKIFIHSLKKSLDEARQLTKLGFTTFINEVFENKLQSYLDKAKLYTKKYKLQI